jgi:hypothetical protein
LSGALVLLLRGNDLRNENKAVLRYSVCRKIPRTPDKDKIALLHYCFYEGLGCFITTPS